MSKYKWAAKAAKTSWPIVRNAAIGGVAGSIAGRVVSSAEGAEAGQHRGAQVGALSAAALGLPFGKLARGTQKFSRVIAAGLKAKDPGSKAAKALNVADRGYTQGRVVFRRIRGRIIPIFKKAQS